MKGQEKLSEINKTKNIKSDIFTPQNFCPSQKGNVETEEMQIQIQETQQLLNTYKMDIQNTFCNLFLWKSAWKIIKLPTAAIHQLEEEPPNTLTCHQQWPTANLQREYYKQGKHNASLHGK